VAVVVDVGLGALRTSHASHRAGSDRLSPGPSANLLLFYAVECGLKAELIDRRRLRGTAQVEKDLLNHNLRGLAKELNMGTLMDRLKDCRKKHDKSRSRICTKRGATEPPSSRLARPLPATPFGR
jgi:hypothetical protein